MFTKWREGIPATGRHKMIVPAYGGHRANKLLMEFIS